MDKMLNITYMQFLTNCKELKIEYQKELYPDIKKDKVKEWRELVYKIECDDWRRDYIWEYLNGDLPAPLLFINLRCLKKGRY